MASPLEELAVAMTDALVSHVQASGYFERVNGHEPKSSPGTGLTGAVWVQAIRPVSLHSGLSITSALLIYNVRIYSSMLQQPEDMIDPNLVQATAALMYAYSGDFTLDGLISNIDLLGATGSRLEALAGYLTIDNTKYRVMTITVPCIVNDVFVQAP